MSYNRRSIMSYNNAQYNVDTAMMNVRQAQESLEEALHHQRNAQENPYANHQWWADHVRRARYDLEDRQSDLRSAQHKLEMARIREVSTVQRPVVNMDLDILSSYGYQPRLTSPKVVVTTPVRRSYPTYSDDEVATAAVAGLAVGAAAAVGLAALVGNLFGGND
jgi:hypothetical protein